MSYRSQTSARTLAERRNITFDELCELKHTTRHEMPAYVFPGGLVFQIVSVLFLFLDRHVIPELLAAIDRFGTTNEIR